MLTCLSHCCLSLDSDWPEGVDEFPLTHFYCSKPFTGILLQTNQTNLIKAALCKIYGDELA